MDQSDRKIRTDQEQCTVSTQPWCGLEQGMCACQPGIVGTHRSRAVYSEYMHTQPWCGLEQCTATCVEALGLTW